MAKDIGLQHSLPGLVDLLLGAESTVRKYHTVIDEYSMLGQATFGWIDRRCKQITGYSDQPFGGISLILTGDPGKFPPVSDKPFIMQSQTISNLSDFADATGLYFSNDEVAKYNHDQLTIATPIANNSAHRTSLLSKKASPDEIFGLEPLVFLAKGAKVMLTMNLWANVGLCNGATGVVVDIVYQIKKHQPPDLPITVIFKFDNYIGPSISDTTPACVPICPVTVSAHLSEGVHERQQLPIKFAWSMTIHKSQGITLPKAWIDIGKSEKTPGIAYVALSNVSL
ncbi:ATP-dependent DNA helicase PIF1-like [Nematostella vectensis]|uniref:ATP-dependent DNA helicase PIF1-like n=1 Tax=Nematostella vectensis TaxID=45351 RepID=UPI00207761DB|nr:ATP-dependent DNA helicase PIF1-like [Nematostella vectensis]